MYFGHNIYIFGASVNIPKQLIQILIKLVEVCITMLLLLVAVLRD